MKFLATIYWYFMVLKSWLYWNEIVWGTAIVIIFVTAVLSLIKLYFLMNL